MLVNFHDPREMANPAKESFVAIPGYEYEVELTPSKVIADPSLQAVSCEYRKCKMPEESESLLFMRTYTQHNCQLENAIVSAIHEAKCVPRILHTLHFTYGPCSREEELSLFNSINLAQINQSRARCPEACELTTYKYVVKVTKLNPPKVKKECFGNLASFLAKNTLPHTMEAPLKVSFISLSNTEKEQSLEDNLKRGSSCRQLLKDTAIIRIKPGVQHVNVIKQRKRVSFTSQLAIFGNDLYEYSLASLVIFDRWFNGSLHRNERLGHSGNDILVLIRI